MDFQLTEEQKLFKQTVHDFADSRIAPWWTIGKRETFPWRGKI
jgi:hypothetical protein